MARRNPRRARRRISPWGRSTDCFLECGSAYRPCAPHAKKKKNLWGKGVSQELYTSCRLRCLRRYCLLRHSTSTYDNRRARFQPIRTASPRQPYLDAKIWHPERISSTVRKGNGSCRATNISSQSLHPNTRGFYMHCARLTWQTAAVPM